MSWTVTIGPTLASGLYEVTVTLDDVAQAAAAQMAISAINAGIADGTVTLDISTDAGALSFPTVGALALAIEGTTPRGVNPPTNTELLAVTAPGVTVAGAGSNSAQVAIFSGKGDAFINQSQTVTAFVNDIDPSAPNLIINKIPVSDGIPSMPETFDLAGVNLISSDGSPSFATIEIRAEPGSTSFLGTGFIDYQATSGAVTVVSNEAGVLPNGVSASTISGGGADVTFFGNGGTVDINQGSGHTIIFGGTGEQFVNQNSSNSGSVTVISGSGDYVGGSNGTNLMFTNTVPAQTQLTGNGEGDFLVSYASEDTLQAGAGNETLFGAASGTVFRNGSGASTISASAAGGNTFKFGFFPTDTGPSPVFGDTLVFGAHSAGSQGNIYDIGLEQSTSYVSGFQSGIDFLTYAYAYETPVDFQSFFQLTYDALSNTTFAKAATGGITVFFNAHLTESDIVNRV